MAECDILDPSVIIKYLNGPLSKGGRTNPPGYSRPYTIQRTYECWEAPTQTYNDFVTGVTQTYDEMCLRDQTWSSYVTKLFKSCLSGGTGGASGATIYVTGGTAVVGTSTLTFTNSSGGTFNVSNGNVLFNDAFVSGGTLDAGTGCVTFRNTSGGTFQVCGFDGFTSYWSANTFGISNSGLTNENVGIGTSTPNKPLTVTGDISGTSTIFAQSISTSGGILTASEGNSTQWNSAYNNTINTFTDSGTDTITLTLTQVDGGTLTTDFSNPQGTVTSVAATHAGDAFSVGGSPVTNNGTLAITLAGSSSQYIDGAGNLTTFPTIPQGDITEVLAGTGLDGGGNTGSVTLNIDYIGTDNFIDSATNLEGTAIAVGDTIVYHDADDNNVKKGFVSDLPFTNNSGTMSSWKIGSTTGTDLTVSDGETVDVVGGTGISGSVGGTRTVTLNLDDTAVTPNTYTNATITVDQQGRLTSAASGTDADYWSANTFGISNSGLTGHVGIGTNTPNKPLTVVGDISGTTALYLGRDDIFISGETQVNGDLSIHSGDDIELYAGDDIVFNTDCRIKFTELNSQSPSLEFELDNGPGIAFIQNGQENTVIAITSADTRLYFNDIGGEYIVGDGTNLTIAAGTDIFLNGDVNVSGFLGVTGKTYLGTIDPAGGGYTADKILVAQNGGEVEYLTIAQLKDDIADADYWSGNTDGSISNSGLTTTKVGIGSNTPTHKLHVKGNSASDDPVKLETVQAGRGYVLVIDDAGVVYKSKSTSGTISASTLEVTGDVKASGKLTGATLDISGNADIDGTITGNLTGEVTGNASTATKIASITNANIVQLTDTQTLTNKTLTTPVISSISNSGTVTIPTGADTLVARTSTDTLTNKTLTAPVIAMGTNKITGMGDPTAAQDAATKAYVDASHPAESDTLQDVTARGATSNQAITLTNTLTVGVDGTGHDVKFFGDTSGQYMLWDQSDDKLIVTGEIEATKFDGALEGNADTATKIASITNANIVQLTDTQTLTNKTLTSPTLTTPVLGTPSSGNLSNCTGYPAGQLPSNIDATKIADGSVTNTEFQYINTLSSNAQTQLDSKLPKAGGTMSGAIAMGTSKITGMGNPTADQDAATKVYVDTQVGANNDLQEVTDNGATTDNVITVAGLTTSGNITLNGDSDKIILGAGGDGEIYVDTDNLIISNTTSDKDIIFNGLDNGSDITALTLDMSDWWYGHI